MNERRCQARQGGRAASRPAVHVSGGGQGYRWNPSAEEKRLRILNKLPYLASFQTTQMCCGHLTSLCGFLLVHMPHMSPTLSQRRGCFPRVPQPLSITILCGQLPWEPGSLPPPLGRFQYRLARWEKKCPKTLSLLFSLLSLIFYKMQCHTVVASEVRPPGVLGGRSLQGVLKSTTAGNPLGWRLRYKSRYRRDCDK